MSQLQSNFTEDKDVLLESWKPPGPRNVVPGTTSGSGLRTSLDTTKSSHENPSKTFRYDSGISLDNIQTYTPYGGTTSRSFDIQLESQRRKSRKQKEHAVAVSGTQTFFLSFLFFFENVS